MKIMVNDPMPALRQARKDHVNENFSRSAALTLHQDLAHAQKRQWATGLDGGHARLEAEAELRGISIEALRALILSKPDALAARELQRQQILLQIDAALTPQALDAL